MHYFLAVYLPCKVFADVLLVVPTGLHHVHCPQHPVLRRLVFQLHQVLTACADRRDPAVPAATRRPNRVRQSTRVGLRHANPLLLQLLRQFLHLQSVRRLLQAIPETMPNLRIRW